VSKEDTRTLKERAEAWNRGEKGAFPQWDDPDDITLAQPKRRPTTRDSMPRPGKEDQAKSNEELLERLRAWNRGDMSGFPQDDPDDVTVAQPKLPTTKPVTPPSSANSTADTSSPSCPKD
jgi:hypothetical protein